MVPRHTCCTPSAVGGCLEDNCAGPGGLWPGQGREVRGESYLIGNEFCGLVSQKGSWPPTGPPKLASAQCQEVSSTRRWMGQRAALPSGDGILTTQPRSPTTVVLLPDTTSGPAAPT